VSINDERWIYKAADDKRLITLISLDISAAFDIISHSILLQRFPDGVWCNVTYEMKCAYILQNSTTTSVDLLAINAKLIAFSNLLK